MFVSLMLTSFLLHCFQQMSAFLTDALLCGAFGNAKSAKHGHGEAPLSLSHRAIAEEKTR